MVQTVPINSSLSAFLVDSNVLSQSSKSAASASVSSVSRISCSASRNNVYIPKLEPFSRNKIDRAVKEPPLIQKSEAQIADYCSTLEGDDSYNCWTAYFELKELEKETPKEELEKLIIEAGGVKSLISFVHGVASIHKAKQDCSNLRKQTNLETSGGRACPVPDGLPKTSEELEEEEKARMPDSPFTRLLRARGKHPAWYTPAPEHETD
ncbi:CCG-binding protein 1 [Sesamum indicum]|uniref:CCG-binding protein 1 n=1 Tax=Sesamum indicum TaxID=4182 RepID=A0A6I9TX00_SESIN|nr:CCG-binding protein 1 [Sesamum indicum]